MKKLTNISKDNIKYTLFSIILVFLLLFPAKHIYIYMMGLMVILTISCLTGVRAFPNPIPYILLGLIYISSVMGIFVFETDAIRNSTELFRVILFVISLIFFYSLDPQKSFNIFKIISFYFIVLNFFLMLSQFFQIGLANLFTSIYSADNHIEISLGMSNRALGLSTGPGQAGLISVAFFSVFYAFWLLGDKSKKTIIIIFLALISVLLSQSQTSFITIFGIILYGIGYSSLKLKKIKPFIIIFLLIIIGFISLWDFITTDLRYLFSLFDQGIERSSYKAREFKTAYLFSLTLDNFFGIMFGYGKDYFGDHAGAMDNEYMFLYGVYGLIFFLIIIFSYLSIIIKSWLVKKQFFSINPYLLPTSFLIICGMVTSWPASFILDIRVMLILTFFIAIYFKQKI